MSLTIANLPPRRDLSSLIAKKDFGGRVNGFYAITRGTGEKICLPLKNFTAGRQPLIHSELPNDVEGVCALSDTPTINGDCGSPMIAMTPQGPMIVGIHTLYHARVAMSAQIWEEMFTPCVIQSGAPLLELEGTTIPVESLSKKSVFRYMEKGHANVYGSFSGFRRGGKSTVEISPLADSLLSEGFSVKYTKPMMKGWSPWRQAGVHMVDTITKLNPDVLEVAKKSFLKDILSNLKKDDLDMLQVYDEFTAVNGCAGVAYVDGINRNTSAGFPWKKSKKFLLKNMEDPKNPDAVIPSEAVMERMRQYEDHAKQGIRSMPVFVGHLKDEAVTYEKAAAGKTRVFTGAPFDWSILVRKYLLSSIRLMQNKRYVFESAPGTIAQSSEWDDFYHYLTAHGEDRIVAGDYSKFDKKMPPEIILASFEIIKEMCEASGNFTPEQLRVITTIGYDTAFPLVDFNGDLVMFHGSNPSGHPLTVTINGLANCLYMRYCYWILNPEHECDSFKINVNLMTYGDDNIMGVRPGIEWFNHKDISECLAHVGIGYTMADKTSESIPFINIRDASFLKRSWRYEEELEKFVCPLEWDSIEKMLMVWTISKTVSLEEQGMAVIETALRESFWYGRSTFNRMTKLMQKTVKTLNWEDWVKESTFPTFAELCKQYTIQSEKLESRQ